MSHPETHRSSKPTRSRRAAGLPASIGALAAYFVSRGVVAVMMGLPLSASAAHVVGDHPRGDAVLWDDGGVWLFELLRSLEPAAAGLAWSTALVGLGATFALLVPLAVLIASLRPPAAHPPTPPASPRRMLAMAADRFGSLALLMGVVLLLQAMAYALWALLGSTVLRSIDLLPATRDVSWLAVLVVGALIPWLFGVAHDVARVGMVRHALGLLDSLELALRTLGRAGRKAVFAAGWRGGCSSAGLVVAGWAGLIIDCHAPLKLAAVVAIHGLALSAAVLLRASWLRWVSLRIADDAEIALPAGRQLHYMVVRSSAVVAVTQLPPR